MALCPFIERFVVVEFATPLRDTHRPYTGAVAAFSFQGECVSDETLVACFDQRRIFPNSFSDEDRKRRSELTGTWAREFNAKSHKLDPHILTLETVRRGPVIPEIGETWPITAPPLIEAHDLNEATLLADAHPALGFNTNAEIRAGGTPAQIV